MKYRKKHVIIDAFQLDSKEVIKEDWFWDAVNEGIILIFYFGSFHPEDNTYNDTEILAYCDIKTSEETMTANTGDYIIKGINGEIYPCKPDIFEKTYELVESEGQVNGRQYF